jgi:uncharacterized protein YdaU (DUF1376 family)
MKWYKRDPDAAYVGMMCLTVEECGAYNRLIDQAYSRDGDLPDDDVFLARVVGTQPRKWRRLKAGLIRHGKIWPNGKQIEIKRVLNTISEAQEFSSVQRLKAKSRWESKTAPCQSGNALTTTIRKKEEDTTNVVSLAAPYFFENGVIRLSEKDFKKWEGAFVHLDLRAELIALTEWAGQQPKWFFAVAGALAKRNRSQRQAAGRPAARNGWDAIL